MAVLPVLLMVILHFLISLEDQVEAMRFGVVVMLVAVVVQYRSLPEDHLFLRQTHP